MASKIKPPFFISFLTVLLSLVISEVEAQNIKNIMPHGEKHLGRYIDVRSHLFGLENEIGEKYIISVENDLRIRNFKKHPALRSYRTHSKGEFITYYYDDTSTVIELLNPELEVLWVKNLPIIKNVDFREKPGASDSIIIAGTTKDSIHFWYLETASGKTIWEASVAPGSDDDLTIYRRLFWGEIQLVFQY